MRVTEIRRDSLMRLWARYELVDGTDEWRIRNEHLLDDGELSSAPVVPHVHPGGGRRAIRSSGEGARRS